jgi:hypothetical protein
MAYDEKDQVDDLAYQTNLFHTRFRFFSKKLFLKQLFSATRLKTKDNRLEFLESLNSELLKFECLDLLLFRHLLFSILSLFYL